MIGLKKQNLQMVMNQTPHEIFLGYMHHNHFLNGRKKDGYTTMILVDGFNGIAGITWDAEYPMRILVKSNDGMQFVAMLDKYKKIAELEIFTVDQNSDKHYSIGHMTVENYKKNPEQFVRDFCFL